MACAQHTCCFFYKQMPTYREKKKRLQELVKQKEEERIRQLQQKGHDFVKTDAFRVQEKKYKHYAHIQTDYSGVFRPEDMELLNVGGYKVYKLNQPEGVYLIKDFICVKEQYQVGFQAINDFIRKPYRTNLDGTNGLYLEKEEKEEKEQQEGQEKPQINNKGPYNFPVLERVDEPYELKGFYFDERIRMANLGYQYDWPHRCYPETQVPIPATVKQLTQRAKILYSSIISAEEGVEYHGQAVIVNYYKPKDYMIGHLDDGEEDQQNPIFSFNFGLSCVFLIGYPDKQQQPHALILQAGDLLIMSGFSRICYHGVPRIIENSYQEPNKDEALLQTIEQIDSQKDEQVRKNGFIEVMRYFSTHRLNLNVRQVWKHKQEFHINQ